MQIHKPTLLINKEICLANIRKMCRKTIDNNLIFRPHFKTHQSVGVGKWFSEFKIDKITVSSVSMAQKFSESGWNDITIAFALNELEINEINMIAKKINLNLTVLDSESIKFLGSHLHIEVGVFIKIDTGYHRTGVNHDDIDTVIRILNEIDQIDNVSFKGFLTHSGHTYSAKSTDEILSIFEDTKRKMLKLKHKFISRYPGMIISIGDTPSCSLAKEFKGIDEIRPGNFTLYDIMQEQLGACKYEDIAIAVACPVIATYPERNEIVIYGGAVHLSKEALKLHSGDCYGKVVKLEKNNWSLPIKNAFVKKISQEHGVIQIDNANLFNRGDVIGILPIHSCLTVNLFENYLDITNNWKIEK